MLVSLDAQAAAGTAELDLHARISVNEMPNAATEANLQKQFMTVVKMSATVILMTMSATIGQVFGVSISLLLNSLEPTLNSLRLFFQIKIRTVPSCYHLSQELV